MSTRSDAKHLLPIVAVGALLIAAELLSPCKPLAQGCSDQATAWIKTDSPDPVAPGGRITYTIDLDLGTTPGSNGAITDQAPVQTTFVSISGPAGWFCGIFGGTPTCLNGGSFMGLQRFTFVVDVAPAATGTIDNIAEASFTGTYGQVNCTATATTTVSAVGVGVGDTPGHQVTGIDGLVPNPSQGHVRIQFALREPGEVEFQVLDMVGRRVSTLAAERRGVGAWSVNWEGRGRSGLALPAGVYFVQMKVNGEKVGLARLALVR